MGPAKSKTTGNDKTEQWSKPKELQGCVYLDRLSHDSPSEVLVLVSRRHLHTAWLSDYEEIFHLKEQPSPHHIPSFRIFAKAKNIVYFIQQYFFFFATLAFTQSLL